jgi:antitoxin-like ribbon-helix-helix protein
MTRKPDLYETLSKAGGSTRHREAHQAEPETLELGEGRVYRQPGRAGTKPITVHFPKNVRDQLKILAVKEDASMQDLVAEAFNDFFAKHGMPEIAPTSRKRR